MNRLIIIGASGHGKVIADMALQNGYKDIVFLDDDEGLLVEALIRGEPVPAFEALPAPPDCAPLFHQTRIDDFRIFVVARRAVHLVPSHSKSMDVTIIPSDAPGVSMQGAPLETM